MPRTTNLRAITARAAAAVRTRPVLALFALVAVVAPWAAAVHPAPSLSPDDALYLSVAHSINEGHGASMPSREPFVVRPPLFPAALAGAMKVAGDPGGIRLLRAVITSLLAVSLLALGRLWYSTLSGLIAVGLAFTNSAFVELASSLRIDAFAAAICLPAIAAMSWATDRPSTRRAVLAGALFGAAVLTKETALVVGVAPLLVGLVRSREERLRWLQPTLVIWLTAAAICAPWWGYAWVVTGRFYLTSFGGAAAVVLGILASAFLAVLAAAAVWLYRTPAWAEDGPVAGLLATGPAGPLIAGVALFGWWAATSLVLLMPASTGSSEDVGSGGLSLLLRGLDPFLVPMLLAVLGLAVLAGYVVQRHRGATFSAAVIAVYLPVAAVIAARAWATGTRNLLVPLLMLQLAIGFGFAALDRLVGRAADESDKRSAGLAVAASAMVLVIAIVTIGAVWQKQQDYRSPEASRVRQAIGWDKGEVRQAAEWLDRNVPNGTVVMTSWLYGSQLSRLTRAAYPMPLLPVREVHLARDADENLFDPAGNLFRFANYRYDDGPRPVDDLLFVRKHPREGYYAGLWQSDLIAELRRTRAGFLVLTGEHHTQSTATIEPALAAIPGLEPVYGVGSPRERIAIFSVDLAALAPAPGLPVSLNGFTLFRLLEEVAAARDLGDPEVVGALGGARLTLPVVTDADRPGAERLRQLLEFLRAEDDEQGAS